MDAALVAPTRAARRGRPFGLSAARYRLILLYALATGPLLLLLAMGAWVDRNQALQTAGQQAENIARIGALQHADMVKEAQAILAVLARIPEVRQSLPECHTILNELDANNPRLSGFAVVSADGFITCSSSRRRIGQPISDPAFLDRGLATPDGAVAISGVVLGRATGRPTVIVARGLRDSMTGSAVGVLSASLNLDWFQQLSSRLSGTPATLVEIIDTETGTVSARSVADQVVTSGQAAAPVIVRAIRAHPEGGSTQADVHDAMHTVGFAALPGTQGRFFITTALPERTILASSNYHLTLNALGFLGAAMAAITLAWLAADRSLLRPIRQLVASAASIGRGDLRVRVGALPGAVEELRTLGREFDGMAERLRARDERIAAMGDKIAQSEEHHRLLADNAGDMLGRFDGNFTRTYISPACRDITGYEPEELVNTNIVDIVLESDRSRVRSQLVRPLLNGAETARYTYRVQHKHGGEVWIETFGRRLSDGSGFVTVARDVSLQKELEAQLEAANQQLRVQVMQDPLTGIANRRRFDEMLGVEFRRAHRLQEPLSLLMVDIDHFKKFNDLFGHMTGDECLRAVAKALAAALHRPGDLVGRYGGEEFAIILPSTPLSGAARIAERARMAVSDTRLPGRVASHALSVSVGTATIMPPIGDAGPASLVEAADNALYEAKRDGRNCVRLGTIQAILLSDAMAPQT